MLQIKLSPIILYYYLFTFLLGIISSSNDKEDMFGKIFTKMDSTILWTKSSHVFKCVEKLDASGQYIVPVLKMPSLERWCVGILVHARWVLAGNAKKCMHIDPILEDICPVEERQNKSEKQRWMEKEKNSDFKIKRQWVSFIREELTDECEIEEVHELMEYSQEFGQMSLLKLNDCNNSISTAAADDNDAFVYPRITKISNPSRRFFRRNLPIYLFNPTIDVSPAENANPQLHAWEIKKIENINESVICGVENKLFPKNIAALLNDSSSTQQHVLEGAPIIFVPPKNTDQIYILALKNHELTKSEGGCSLNFNDHICLKIEQITKNEVKCVDYF